MKSLWLQVCSGSAKSGLSQVVGGEGQLRGAQVQGMHLSDQEGWTLFTFI